MLWILFDFIGQSIWFGRSAHVFWIFKQKNHTSIALGSMVGVWLGSRRYYVGWVLPGFVVPCATMCDFVGIIHTYSSSLGEYVEVLFCSLYKHTRGTGVSRSGIVSPRIFLPFYWLVGLCFNRCVTVSCKSRVGARWRRRLAGPLFKGVEACCHR